MIVWTKGKEAAETGKMSEYDWVLWGMIDGPKAVHVSIVSLSQVAR